MKFESVDEAMAIGREYLTMRGESIVLLDKFESSLAAFRRPDAEIRAEVRNHAEFLQNSGRLRQEDVPGFRAALEKFGLSHRKRLLDILERTYTLPTATGEHAERLRKLREVIAVERKREN